jgi:hypothetical protein
MRLVIQDLWHASDDATIEYFRPHTSRAARQAVRASHSNQVPDPAKRIAGLNVRVFASPELDTAIDAARNPQVVTGCDQTARAQHYDSLNKLLNSQQPYLSPSRPTSCSPPHRLGSSSGHLLALCRYPPVVAPEVNGWRRLPV